MQHALFIRIISPYMHHHQEVLWKTPAGKADIVSTVWGQHCANKTPVAGMYQVGLRCKTKRTQINSAQ